MDNLGSELKKSACYSLNEDSSHPYSNLFVGDHTLFLQSDSDEQLIVSLAFNQTVSLKQLQFGLFGDESCPNTIKLFANQSSVSFSDANDLPPTQTITLTPPGTESTITTVSLQAARWQRVDSITLFIENNHGAPVTKLHALRVFGSTVHSTNVNEIHKKHEH